MKLEIGRLESELDAADQGKPGSTGVRLNSVKNLTCFKAYDVRGKLGEELDEGIAYRIGRATAQSQKARTVVVGFDARARRPI